MMSHVMDLQELEHSIENHCVWLENIICYDQPNKTLKLQDRINICKKALPEILKIFTKKDSNEIRTGIRVK